MIDLVRRRLADDPVDRAALVRRVGTSGRKALQQLDQCFAGYGVRPPG